MIIAVAPGSKGGGRGMLGTSGPYHVHTSVACGHMALNASLHAFARLQLCEHQGMHSPGRSSVMQLC